MALTKNRETAEEIVLDVFTKIWEGRAALSDIRNFEAFLFRVAQNKGIDFLRQLQRNRRLQGEVFEMMQDLRNETADYRIQEKEARMRLGSILSLLPAKRREAFILSREEDLSYDEIAEKMSISRLTVRNHVSAALKFIRDHIDPLEGRPEMIIGLLLMFLL